MINGPDFSANVDYAIIDGMNVALRRPGYQAGAFVDLTNCIEFFRRRKIKALVVLDRRSESEAFFEQQTVAGRDLFWLVTQGEADIIILETALRLPKSVILSNDDFAEYQTRYASLVFSLSRVLGFEWKGGLGSGVVDFRRVREKSVSQALVDSQLIQQFPDIADMLFAVGNTQEADSLIEYVRDASLRLERAIPAADFVRAYRRTAQNLQAASQMIAQADVSKGCKIEDVEGKVDGELYVVTPRAIAQSAVPGLAEYSGKIMCRKHAMMLAAKFQLNPSEDFQTRESLRSEEEGEKKKLDAYSELVDWLEAYEVLPDINGKPPMLGGQYMCRKCADLLPTEDLFVFSKRWLSNLHPDLGPDSNRPNGSLYGRSFCKAHFEEIFEEIAKIEKEAGVVPRSVANDGVTHLSLERLLQYALKTRPRKP